MDEVYRSYRITVKAVDAGFVARVTHVRGRVLPLAGTAEPQESAALCLMRSREAIDAYLDFLGPRPRTED